MSGNFWQTKLFNLYNQRSVLCKFSAVVVCLLIFVYYGYLRFGVFVDLKKEFLRREYFSDDEINGISLDHCKIPLVELNNPEYLRAYQDIPTLMDEMKEICASTPDFSKLENNKLYLTDTTFKNCCVTEVTRKWRDSLDNYILSDSCVQIGNHNNGLDVAHMEFIEGRLKPKIDFWKNQSSSERPYSIFTLVIDSTSRAEFFRSLTQTVDHLLSTMNFVNFRGHHPLGEPTQNNAMPMLMGIQRSVFKKEYIDYNEQKFWDETPFIWRSFNELNYLTGYFEDDPAVGTFNYGRQLGFEVQPTHLYTRPLMAAHTDGTNYSDYKQYCFGHRNVIEFMLDYHFETLLHLSEVPTFQVTWPCWIQHNYGGSLSFLDHTYKNFFKKISENSQILENAMLVVVSDHGFYKTTPTDGYAVTHGGLLERRNVPLFVRLPDRLQREHPEMVENLKWNSQLITSHYDIYQTFVQIAKMSGETAPLTNLTTYGSSLLEKIPRNRTCKEARIPETMLDQKP
ncbi:unnamed protein product [Allacma fusca]|uniref:Uncharacterized protein n=1 Tax=Allacma fusca TaxID=39272 RepID=A0A8J2NII8_9HEXA|nr:unnamed protein product [Allacma fusca]